MSDRSVSRPEWKGRAEVWGLWTTARKILAQELRTGCSDRTVFGGLEKFLSNWVSSLTSVDASFPTWPEGRHLVGMLQGYRDRAVDERAASVEAALALIDQVMDRMATLDRAGTAGPSTPGDVRQEAGRRGRQRAQLSTRCSLPPGSPHHPDRSPARSTLPLQPSSLELGDPVLALKGVGKQRASLLAKLGIRTIKDLLLHYPRDYRDYRTIKRVADLMYGETASVVGTVEDVQVTPGARGLVRTTIRLRDESGRVSAVWFRRGYAGLRVAPGSRIALAGTTSGYGGLLTFESPDWELADAPPLHTRRLVPVYPLTEGVSDYWLREMMQQVVPVYANRLHDPLPLWVREDCGLIPLSTAVEEVHFPKGKEELARAIKRLAFDEIFVLQVAAQRRRAEWQSGPGAPEIRPNPAAVEGFLAEQPFTLTGAQRRVLEEIMSDMASARPMTRLLQGEVGSGKTIVAAVALLAAVLEGYQAALMAPTEILAEQHFRTLEAAFERASGTIKDALGRPLRVELLTGASRRSDRERVYRGTAEGEVDILVGTQALIQEGLEFRRLALAVIDEQHRFGVLQRTALRQKGGTPHLLVMTATPIPRTMALVLYGDLELSVIDELPPGRQQVRTYLLRGPERVHAYERIRREVAQGRQAFVICPLVEDSPHLEVRAATAEYERLRRGDLSGLRLALLHGRMRPAEKDRIMLDFRNGQYDVLISTSVVEVGIDVPNATVMVVEGAERFGLAQLHQFRGRVGRGRHPSACLLLTDATEPETLERLKLVADLSDGFRLADEDLRLRGPGEYMGVRQSGFPDFRMADLRDVELIERAREVAQRLIERDPELALPENRDLAVRIEELRLVGSS